MTFQPNKMNIDQTVGNSDTRRILFFFDETDALLQVGEDDSDQSVYKNLIIRRMVARKDTPQVQSFHQYWQKRRRGKQEQLRCLPYFFLIGKQFKFLMLRSLPFHDLVSVPHVGKVWKNVVQRTCISESAFIHTLCCRQPRSCNGGQGADSSTNRMERFQESSRAMNISCDTRAVW